MKGTAGAAGAAALAGLGLWYGTQPAMAATTFQESDGTVTVTTNAGEVMDVRIAPVFALDWANFGGGVSGIDFDLSASVGGSNGTIYSETGLTDSTAETITTFDTAGLDAYDGTVSISCAPQSIIGSGITTESFPTGVAEGASESQTVTLTLSPSGTTNLGGSTVSGDDATLSFDVVVENPAGTVTATIESSNAEADGADTAAEANTSSA